MLVHSGTVGHLGPTVSKGVEEHLGPHPFDQAAEAGLDEVAVDERADGFLDEFLARD